MSKVYLFLAVLGAIAPYIFFFQFIEINGFDIGLFVSSLFVNGASGGFAADLLISSIALWLFIFSEKKISPWPFILINIVIGLSCALPLYLYFRGQYNFSNS